MLRNRELAHFALLLALLGAASAAAGFGICPAAGILALISGGAYALAFFVFTWKRYQCIASLSAQIDQVLHDSQQLYFDEAEEGELSILQSEIGKMVLRIHTQNEALKREKSHLAESLADIAHQLRTPLTSASILITLLANTPEEEQKKALLRDAERFFVQMDWLITALLKLSRLDAGIVAFQKGPVSVRALFTASLQPLMVPMELREISVQTDVPEDAVIQGDFPWLCEALQNILKNCMEQAGEQGVIALNCKDNLLYTELSIHDSGPGFSQEDLPRLFERFYRGKNTSAAGYGIGLALCRTIITRQGGTVTAKNHPNGGAMFIIRFPKVTHLSPESHPDVS